MNSLLMFIVVLCTAFCTLSKTCFPAFPEMLVISLSKFLDHLPSKSTITFSWAIMYSGFCLDNSCLSGPYLSIFCVPLCSVSTQRQLSFTMSTFLAKGSTKRASTCSAPTNVWSLNTCTSSKLLNQVTRRVAWGLHV